MLSTNKRYDVAMLLLVLLSSAAWSTAAYCTEIDWPCPGSAPPCYKVTFYGVQHIASTQDPSPYEACKQGLPLDFEDCWHLNGTFFLKYKGCCAGECSWGYTNDSVDIELTLNPNVPCTWLRANTAAHSDSGGNFRWRSEAVVIEATDAANVITVCGASGWVYTEGGYATFEPCWNCTDCSGNDCVETIPIKVSRPDASSPLLCPNLDCCPIGDQHRGRGFSIYVDSSYASSISDVVADVDVVTTYHGVRVSDSGNDCAMVSVLPQDCVESGTGLYFLVRALPSRTGYLSTVSCSATFLLTTDERVSEKVTLEVTPYDSGCCDTSAGEDLTLTSTSASYYPGAHSASVVSTEPSTVELFAGHITQTIALGTDPTNDVASAQIIDSDDPNNPTPPNDVSVEWFGQDGSFYVEGEFRGMPGWTGEADSNDAPVVTADNNVKYEFDLTEGYLVEILDPCDADRPLVVLDYNATGITTQTDEDDPNISFDYDYNASGRLAQITVWDGADSRVYTISYV